MAVVSYGVIGTGTCDGTDVISVPISVSVPRSDPTGGASLAIVITLTTDGTFVTGASDDAATDAFYDTHLYSDGLNPPYVKRAGPGNLGLNGLLLNPLTAGADTISIQLAAATTWGAAIVLGYTGVQVNNQFSPAYQVPDQPTINWFDYLHIPSPFGLFGGNPFTGSGNTRYLQWGLDPVTILNPPAASYPDWSIHEGELAVYFVTSPTFSTTDSGDFTPSDGSWSEIGSLIDVPAPGPTPPSISFAIFEKAVSAPETNGDLDGVWATASDMFGDLAGGISLIAGLGPIWADIPPPSGVPVFHVRYRTGIIDGTAVALPDHTGIVSGGGTDPGGGPTGGGGGGGAGGDPDPPAGGGSEFTTAQMYRDTAHPSTISGLNIHDVTSGSLYGLLVMGYFGGPTSPPPPSPSAFTVSDITTQNIGNVPTTSGGTAEAGIWFGAQVNATRLVADGTWEGLWTGAQCRDSTISDFVVGKDDGVGGYTLPVHHIGIYCEHFTRRVTFSNFEVKSTDNGINIEWWYADAAYASYVHAEYPTALSGKAGSCELTFDGGTIYCPSGRSGIFADAGTWGCVFQNLNFIGPGAAIGLPNNLAGPTANVVDVGSCTFGNSGSNVYYHSNAIG